LMLAALQNEGPAIFMEHKLLSESYLEFLGSGGRQTVRFDVPETGKRGEVPKKWEPLPFGKAVIRRSGSDLTIVSLGVGVHRAIQAAQQLQEQGVSASVVDLRSVAPLDKETVCTAVSETGRLLVVDEDYESFGLSGELAAITLEAGISIKFSRVCTRTTIPYARYLEAQTLPSIERIVDAALKLE
jgi:pyruvate/2-oxoglutarate/acetoin dehydrogenase E1 component